MSDTGIYGDTAACSLYWIDGNTNTTPGIPQGAAFDVDNPRGWLPNTTISGLASGLCERKAVSLITAAGGTVATGATAVLTTGRTWTMGGGAGTQNDAIVADATKNIILHVGNPGTATQIYAAAQSSPMFSYPKTEADGQNYMTKMDDAIADILADSSYQTTVNGGTAYTFSTLAAAATNAANNAQSALARTPIRGGTYYTEQYSPTYPAEWAKERKWMLDQLRYTGAAVAPVTASTICYDVLDLYPAGTQAEKFNAGDNGADLIQAVASAYIYGATVGTAQIIGATVGNLEDHYNGPILNYRPVSEGVALYIKSPYDRPNKLAYALGFIGANTTLNVDDYIMAYCGEYSFVAENGYAVWDEAGAEKITGTTTVTVQAGRRYVLADGAIATLDVDDNAVTIDALSISSGCTAIISPDVVIPKLNIMDGGVMLPTNTTHGDPSKLQAGLLFANYRNTGNTDLLTAGFKYVANVMAADTGSSYFINGGTLTVADGVGADNVYITGNTNGKGVVVFDNNGTDGMTITGHAVIGAHGALNAILTNQGYNPDITRATVLSGGTLTAINTKFSFVTVLNGGCVDITRCHIDEFCIFDGATVSITGNTLMDCRLSDINEVRIGTFQPFTLDVASGWNTFKVVRKDPGTNIAYVTGVSGSTAGIEALVSGATTMAEHMPNVTININGDTDPTNLARLLEQYMWQNFSVLAINGGTATSTAEDHYTDFRVRQFAQ